MALGVKRPLFKRIWWHVVLTHFPISFFMISAGFMALHLLADSVCFERSAFICLAAGTASLLPASLSGWLTWRGRYRAVRAEVFVKKMRIAWVIVPLGAALVLWRTFFKTTVHTSWHYIYSTGIILLFVGVVLEGTYGGRLHHHEGDGAAGPDPDTSVGGKGIIGSPAVR